MLVPLGQTYTQGNTDPQLPRRTTRERTLRDSTGLTSASPNSVPTSSTLPSSPVPSEELPAVKTLKGPLVPAACQEVLHSGHLPPLLAPTQYLPPARAEVLNYRQLLSLGLPYYTLPWSQGEQMMSTDTKTADVGEVAPEAPQPTHIDVHIHQESVLAKLLLAGCSLLRLPASASTRSLGSNRLLVASWVVQIVLGALSVVLGGTLNICKYFAMNTSGAPFWTGITAMLAGIVAFLHKKRGCFCWELWRILLVQASFCTAVAAIVMGANEFNTFHYYLRDDVCLGYSPYVWPTEPPNTTSPEEVNRIALCIFYTSMLTPLIISLQAMLLGVWVLLLLASLTPTCVYLWRRFFTKAKTDEKKLLGANVI
ncbi:transmembrane protein 176A [Sigmodon hispidus]